MHQNINTSAPRSVTKTSDRQLSEEEERGEKMTMSMGEREVGEEEGEGIQQSRRLRNNRRAIECITIWFHKGNHSAPHLKLDGRLMRETSANRREEECRMEVTQRVMVEDRGHRSGESK